MGTSRRNTAIRIIWHISIDLGLHDVLSKKILPVFDTFEKSHFPITWDVVWICLPLLVRPDFIEGSRDSRFYLHLLQFYPIKIQLQNKSPILIQIMFTSMLRRYHVLDCDSRVLCIRVHRNYLLVPIISY